MLLAGRQKTLAIFQSQSLPTPYASAPINIYLAAADILPGNFHVNLQVIQDCKHADKAFYCRLDGCVEHPPSHITFWCHKTQSVSSGSILCNFVFMHFLLLCVTRLKIFFCKGLSWIGSAAIHYDQGEEMYMEYIWQK